MADLHTDNYLEPSPAIADGGAKVGKLPGLVPLADLKALGHPESPIRAIRAKCRDCCGGNDAEVRKCTAIGCPLWPYRMSVNPFHGKGGDRSKVSIDTSPLSANRSGSGADDIDLTTGSNKRVAA